MSLTTALLMMIADAAVGKAANYQLTKAILMIVGLSLLVYLYASSRVPYCIFDSLENEGIIDSTKRFSWAVFVFVVFSVLVGSLRQYLLSI